MAIPFSRLRIALPLIAVILLFALWSIWWVWAISFAEDKFATARADAAGRIELTCDSEHWGGYPYRFMFTCTNARISLKRSGTEIAAPRLDVIAQAYNPQHIIARLTGPTDIVNARRGIAAKASHLPAKLGVKLSGGRFKIATASVRDLDVSTAAGRFSAESVTVHARPSQAHPGGMDFALQSASFSAVPQGAPAVLADTLTGEATIDKLPAGPAGTLEDLARALAAAGSTLSIDALQLTTGALQVTATGDLTINRQGLINGTFATAVNDPALIITGLSERGVLSDKQASGASALLGLFRTKDGVKADLRFKDGQAYWGPLKLGRHSPLF